MTVTRKEVRAAVYYANAWCNEYQGEEPFKLKDFVQLLEIVKAAKNVLSAWNVTETKDSGWDRDGVLRRLHDAIHEEKR